METANIGRNAGQWFEMGQRAGGRTSGVGSALKVLVDTLKEDKAIKQELAAKKELIGYEKEMEAKYRDPSDVYAKKLAVLNAESNINKNRYELGQPPIDFSGEGATPQADNLTPTLGSLEVSNASPTSDKGKSQWIAEERTPTAFGGYRVTKERRVPTQEETDRETRQKAVEQATIATEKERQVNLGKVSRLKTMADVIEKNWKGTSPYSEKVGVLTPALGGIDILKSNLQATDAQRKDAAYRTFVTGIRAQLARAMGDVGNLNETEQNAAINLVPTLWDNKATGELKLKMLRDLVDSIKNNNREETVNILNSSSQMQSGDGQQSQGQYKIGDTIVKNGITYTFNGKDWDY